MSTTGTIKHRTLLTGTNNPAYQVSKDAYNDTFVVSSAAPNGTVMVRDSAQTDGWGFEDPIWVNVTTYGADPNGVVDATDAIADAQDALPASGGVVYFPPGRYLLSGNGIIFKRSNVIFRGAGMYASTIVAESAITLMQVSPSYSISDVAIEDLGFDGGGVAVAALSAYRYLRGTLRVSRCKLWRLGTGLYLAGVDTVLVEDSVFASAGDAAGVGISLAGATKHVAIRGNRFLWLNSGLIVDTGSVGGQTEHVSEYITVEQNYFDLGWWLLTPRFVGSGATVSYSSTTLTDSGAAFSGIVAQDTVRVMPVRRAGTGIFDQNSVSDASANFITADVRRGDIVRTGTAFAVVSHVQSATLLRVEDWLADSDRQPAPIPSNGSYTVYGIYLGSITSNTATTLTVTRFHDFDGGDVTPSAQARYEVLGRPNYPLHVEESTRKIRVLNNTFRRGWADQVSVWGYEAQIIGNTIEDGEDMGITLHGQHNIVQGNTIRHQGAGGIFLTANDSIVDGNHFTDTPWVNNANTINLGHIMVGNDLQSGSRNVIANNICDKGSVTNGRYGIALYWSTGPAVDGNMISGNICRNHSIADVLITGTSTTNTRLLGNVGTVSVTGGATLWNPLLSTGAGATVDQVITALQTLGLVRQT